MTAPIGPGDKVICVDASSHPGCIWLPDDTPPVVGTIYTVQAVSVARKIPHAGTPILFLEEIERCERVCRQFGYRVGYGLYRFRPAGRGGMFNDLLTAKPVRVGEDA